MLPNRVLREASPWDAVGNAREDAGFEHFGLLLLNVIPSREAARNLCVGFYGGVAKLLTADQLLNSRPAPLFLTARTRQK